MFPQSAQADGVIVVILQDATCQRENSKHFQQRKLKDEALFFPTAIVGVSVNDS